jgi:glycosyltransferase involved in cell wall biosynthesis
MLKIFAYHNGFNGVSAYRIWQPMKYLAKMEGFKITQLPKRSERVIWDGLEGPCNVPGIGSHEEICKTHDVIVSNFANSFDNSVRLICQSQLTNLVIDCDDDVLNIEKINPNYASWHRDDEAKDHMVEITPENEAELKSLSAKGNGRFVEVDGTWMFWSQRIPLVQNVLECFGAAKLMTVSTERLKKLYAPYNDNIVVIPNGIDFDNFPVIMPKKNDGFIRLGLFGSNTHYWDWKEIAPVLKKILDDNKNVKLCFNSWFVAKAKPGQTLAEMEKVNQLPEIFEKIGINQHERVEIHEPCEIEDYFTWLASKSIDIGLAPLRDSEFNRAKSNIKYLEWSALRVPTVCQDMEVYNGDIKHRYNGMLAGSKQEWHQALTELIRDEKLRLEMGQRAYLDAKSRYDMPIIARKLAREIKKLTGVNDESIENRAAELGLTLATA